MSFDQIYTLLNKQSGLLGISGLTNDMRDLLQEERQHQDRRARLAIDIFCLRAKQYIGGYLGQMNGADAIIFTGGIGENAPEVRQRICGGLDWIGIQLDQDANAKMIGRKEGLISAPDSRVQVYVIPTNEELLIARDTVRCIENVPRRW
jgi:acetate kinase